MKIVCLIPARLESTRLPGKMLKKIGEYPVIVQTYLAAKKLNLFDDIWVVTENKEIGKAIEDLNGKVFYSTKPHNSGSDRIAEAAEAIEADVIVNVQGDTPLIYKESMIKLLDCFRNNSTRRVDLASLMTKLDETENANDSNIVKVVVDNNDFALYFSRSPIPFSKNNEVDINYYKHIGVYVFRKEALLNFYNSPQTPLEKVESIECLRYLEIGKKIKMVYTDEFTLEIDTNKDLVNAITYFKNN
ncbi:3-deoxy-manno-octulosonate cytidylyltransferase [Flavobacterium sp.]|uniref:3-deoxy-manno-octulosonate cytidylyltransferase n=1 Tax=Flavobacterium sp. TaxID=239 RepID=UPI0022C748B8|nr:3-deoxy-manno-octulosonate cytidylyltransferase [Flavobacterium sp.]MCZ8228284.1 3-deoxy-manno-octulosonate cytidylyltransferase [Flavobacterium sp.]